MWRHSSTGRNSNTSRNLLPFGYDLFMSTAVQLSASLYTSVYPLPVQQSFGNLRLCARLLSMHDHRLSRQSEIQTNELELFRNRLWCFHGLQNTRSEQAIVPPLNDYTVQYTMSSYIRARILQGKDTGPDVASIQKVRIGLSHLQALSWYVSALLSSLTCTITRSTCRNVKSVRVVVKRIKTTWRDTPNRQSD